MNKLIEYFAKQGVFVDLITVFVFVTGIYAMFNIKREVFPNVSFDVITIVTPYPGASPESAERLISSPLELKLKEVDGIKKITSISREGGSTIVLQLDPDQTTAQQAKLDVQEVIDAFTQLPDGAEDPIVTIAESKLQPVIEIALGGEVAEEELRQTAKLLEREMELLREVARTEFNGLRDFEIRVEANPEKLKRYRVSLQEIIQALGTRNVSIPGGTIEAAKVNNFQEMIVRTIGEYETAEDVAKTVIRANAFAEPIRISDVATVRQTFVKRSEIYRVNGLPSISVTVLKKEKADVLDLVDAVKKRLEELRPQINPDIGLSLINDSSFYVRRRISVLTNNLLVGLGLVLLVLSLILPWRVAAITAFGIPFSFLGAMGFFFGFDISINLISMMGLIIVVGMLVDDAIVITENAQRVREKGVSSMEAAIRGTQQIWAPVTVSVLTTVMAFAPFLFMTGIFGKFVRYIPIGVIAALLISLWECFFILPHHLGRWIKDQGKNGEAANGQGVFTRLWEKTMKPAYSYISYYIVRLRYLVALAAILMMAGTFYFAKEKMDFVLFPPGGVEIFMINFETSNGSSLEYTAQVARPVENILKNFDKSLVDDFVVKVGIQSLGANDPSSRIGSEYGQAIVYLTPATERETTAREIIEDLRERVGKPEGIAKIRFEQVSGGPPVGKPVNIGVRGKDYEDILPVVARITEELNKIPGVTDIENTHLLGKKEVQIQIKDSEAAAAGLSLRDIGIGVRAAFEGIVASAIRKLDEEIDIRVSLTQEDRTSVQTLDEIEVSNNRGQLIPLSRVTTNQTSQGIAVYRHEANQREVAVVAEVDTTVSTSREVNALMREKLPEIMADFPDIRVIFGGEDEDTQESLVSLVKAFLLAFFSILLILIMLFQNLYQPFIIATTIPLGFVGVVWTFYLHRMPLSFMGMIGVIALAGVIVNNAIVMVDFVNQLKSEGKDRFGAVREAARIRLRPIFLTTVTTVAGILPTAYGIGGLDPFVVPIALSLGWGMAFGAFLTTLVLPAILVIVDDIIELIGFGKKRPQAVE
ncbi:MAG: efflux RND transporter permease subunit [Oligoflexus sp.]